MDHDNRTEEGLKNLTFKGDLSLGWSTLRQ